MKYWAERLYPGIIAVFCSIIFQRIKIGIMNNADFNNLLGNLVTLDSIVIGFFGASRPVILSMKNESTFVKYVFENDKERLFAKYLKVTIFSGLLSAVFSLSLYVRNSFVHIIVKDAVYTLWVFFSALFLVSTYRSLSYMIALVFSKDDCNIVEKKKREKTDTEKQLEKEYGE